MTNFERIKGMNAVEMAFWLAEHMHCEYCFLREKCRKFPLLRCTEMIFGFLESEVEE